MGRDLRNKWYFGFTEAGDHRYALESHRGSMDAANEIATYVINQQTGEITISPAASDRPQGWQIELHNQIYVGLNNEWVHIPLGRDVVLKSEESYPAKLVAEASESDNARVQVEIHTGDDRDDQLIRFAAFVDPIVQPSPQFPNPTRTTGTTFAQTPPPGWRRATYYSDTHNSQAYAGRFVFTPTGDISSELAPVQMTLRLVGETEAQGTTYALNRDVHGVYAVSYTHLRAHRD